MEKQYLLGINVLGGAAGLNVPQHIDLIKQIGWDAYFTGWDPARTEAWAEAGAKNGLIYQSIHSPFNKVHKMWQEGEEGRAVTDNLIDCVKDCARFDIPVMVIHPFIGFKDHTPTQVGLDNYARVVEVANKLGVKLGFENVEGEEYLAALMKKFWNEPCCGFCLDTGHEQCYNRGKDMMALYGEKLCHTHLNDNVGVTGDDIFWTDDLHLVMGDGKVDWKGVMDRIDRSPYEGVLMCELTLANKPGKNTHDAYNAMTIDAFYAYALERARRVRARTL